jgi:hypothetical protein
MTLKDSLFYLWEEQIKRQRGQKKIKRSGNSLFNIILNWQRAGEGPHVTPFSCLRFPIMLGLVILPPSPANIDIPMFVIYSGAREEWE